MTSLAWLCHAQASDTQQMLRQLPRVRRSHPGVPTQKRLSKCWSTVRPSSRSFLQTSLGYVCDNTWPSKYPPAKPGASLLAKATSSTNSPFSAPILASSSFHLALAAAATLARQNGRLVKTLQRTLGLTVFMVTHDLDSLYTACDRIAVLGGGKIIATGSIADMQASQHPWLRQYFHGKRARVITA